MVIPTFNRAGIITETLDSVRAQRYRPIELIVVDDGSTDDTVDVVHTWAREHQAADLEVRCEQQANAGAPSARNRGARLAAGEFIQFLDSDDLLRPDKLSSAVEALADPTVMFVSHDYERFEGATDNTVERSVLSSRSDDPSAHLRQNRLHTLSAVYRREALNAAGPWCEDLNIWQDTEFGLRVLLSGGRGLWLAEVGALVRDSPGSIMNQSLTKSWPSMLASAEVMEGVASAHGVLDARFRSAMGSRLATVSRRLAEVGAWDDSRKMFGEAVSRLGTKDRTLHHVHRWGMRVLGCRLMRQLGLM
ncbi:MAG: glycosyltransferase family A protein [Planctomycetota bacterium]|nr:glycosyltransferase family A protein [Planctomycetota bacterium]